MDTQLNYYLEDLKRLDEVTVTELETLAVKFPFDQTIRILLAEKLSFDDNSKVNAHLYSSSLFKIQPNGFSKLKTNISNLDIPELIDIPTPLTIQDKQIEIEQMNEVELIDSLDDVFDEGLEDVSEVEKEFEPTDLVETIEEVDSQELDFVEQEVSLSDNEEGNYDISNHYSDEEDVKPMESKKNKEILESNTNLNNEAQNIGFTQWLLLLKPISDFKIKKVKKKKKKDKIKETAKKSIIKSDSIVSEPLANILALQGHYLEAKIMYQKLVDLNPEKKEVFKSKIIEIDQLIDQRR